MENKRLESTPPEFFDDLYAQREDPWGITWARSIRNALSGKFYEQRRYWRVQQIIPCQRYRSALEIGCSIGVFTKSLGRRCDDLLAIDYSQAAIEYARKRCRKQPHIRFVKAKVPDEFPDGDFDLIVLSEVAYYLSPEDFLATADRILKQLSPGGYLVMVHYRNHQEMPLSGDFAHDWFITEASVALTHLKDARHSSGYRLDLFQKRLVESE